MGKTPARDFLMKTSLFATMGLFMSGVVIAGSIVVLSCDICGYKSEELVAGLGFNGVENTVVYCPACKKYMVIPTKILSQTKLGHEIKVVVSNGKEVFLGQECDVYTCPKCGKKAFDYHGKICPICLKGRITENAVGEWD